MEKLIEQFGLGLFFWQLLLFVGLVLLLKKFAWKPILDAVNEREEGIREALEAAEKARQDMQALNASNEKLLVEARMERDAMMKEAREIREKMIAEAKEKAEAEGHKLIEQARVAIENEKQMAVAELKAQMATLSIEIAEKVLQNELSDKEAQTKLVGQLIQGSTSN